MKKIILLLAIVFSLTQLGAQDFNRASLLVKKDLDDSLKELADLQKKIADAKIPKAKELSDYEAKALKKRSEFERVRKFLDASQFDLNTLNDRVKKHKDNNAYLNSLLGDYIRRFETRIHIGEVQIYEEELKAAKLAMEDTNLTETDKFRAQLKILDAAFDRLGRMIGGDVFPGNAVVEGGLYEQGQFVIVGPVAYFSSELSEQAGLASLDLNSSNAVVRNIGSGYVAGIKDLAKNNTGIVPIDTTLGDAYKVELTKESIVEHIMKGGVVMYPILGLAFFSLVVALYKFFEIGAVRRAKARDLDTILRHLRNGQKNDALAYARSVKGPVGQMLASAVEYSDMDRELVEEVLYEKIITTQPKLERMLPLIGVTAATAPLLGLLGTVTGMIKTFKLITVFGTGDAKSLSSGISEALITTEFGLIIAIPALIIHALLSRKAKGVIGSMEQTAVGFINGLSSNKDA